MHGVTLQIEQLLILVQQSTTAAGCGIAVVEQQQFQLAHATTVGIPSLGWATTIASIQTYDHYLVLPHPPHHPQEWLVFLPLQSSDRLVGALLLLFYQQPPHEAALVATAALLNQTLYSSGQVYLLRRRILQLERQQAARLREIKNSRNYLRGIIDNIALGLVLLDSDGTVRAINSSLARRFEQEPVALVGQHYGDTLGVWSEAPALQTITTGQKAYRRTEIAQANGSRALLDIASFPLVDAYGTMQRAVEVWNDVTEQTALQNQLVRAEKLAAIGQLAASVAHEVGNPLQAVQGFIALFLETCAPDTANRYYLQVADQEIERVARVVARLRDFYRPGSDLMTAVQINTIISDVLLLASRQLQQSGVTVVSRLTPGLPETLGVADQLKQVVLNLVLNAIEAMPSGGTLTVTTGLCSFARSGEWSDEGKAEAQAILGLVEITVGDTGLGIAPDRLEHLFDGLQTTKARGTGLGLYTSKAVIEHHMGRINVQSVVGAGTTFTIVLSIRREESTL